MVTNDKEWQIIEKELEAYQKATTVQEYQRAITVLNKYHDPRIAMVFSEGLKSKEKEYFPLVAFFATVSALESYEKDPDILNVFMQRLKRDYEERLLEDLSLHRAIEVVHIIVNEAFQTYRNDEKLHDLLLSFLEKKALNRNNEGVYKTIDAFKFFPKKIGPQTPPRLLEGLADITARYYEQQLSGGKNYKEILTYADFFTDKIGREKALQIAKKAEKKHKSMLFVTYPGEFVSDNAKGEVYAQTAIPFAYSDEYKRVESYIKGIEEITAQIGGKVSNLLFDINTQEIEKEIRTDGIKKALANKKTFQLSSSNAREVLGRFPPVIPAFAVANDKHVRDIFNARYVRDYFENSDITFTIFGQTIKEESHEWDRIEGVIIGLPKEHESFHTNVTEKTEQGKLLDEIESVVSDISVEVKQLHSVTNGFIQKSMAEEKDFDEEPFLGFCGEKGREEKKKAMQDARKEHENIKENEIIAAFKRACKKKAIETIDNIDSLSSLELIFTNKDIVDRLALIKGPLAQPARIIMEVIEKYPLVSGSISNENV